MSRNIKEQILMKLFTIVSLFGIAGGVYIGAQQSPGMAAVGGLGAAFIFAANKGLYYLMYGNETDQPTHMPNNSVSTSISHQP